MENAEIMETIDVAMERLERLDLLVAELQGDLGSALNDRDRLAAENARLREAVDALLGNLIDTVTLQGFIAKTVENFNGLIFVSFFLL